MDNSLPVVLSKRGLDPEQVDVALGDVKVELARLEAERTEIDKRVDTLSREVAEVRSALKRSSAKPSFSDLGAAFEQTLRVAEEQAGKLLADAQKLSAETRRSAEVDAKTLVDTAKKQADKTVAEAETRAARLQAESEKKFESTLRIARQQLDSAQAQFIEAEKLAAAISAEGEQKRAQFESELAAEVEQSRQEIETLRLLHERDQRRISDETEAVRAKADRESTRLAAENEAAIAQLLSESQAQLDEAQTRATEILADAQRSFASAREEGIAHIRAARERAAGIVRRARARAATLTERLEERNASLLESGEELVNDLTLERESAEAFNSELRINALTDVTAEEAEFAFEVDEEITVESLDMNDAPTPKSEG